MTIESHVHRRGLANMGVLMVGLGMLAAALGHALVDSNPGGPRQLSEQEMRQQLCSMPIGQEAAILAVHQWPRRGRTELVFWARDDFDPGRINEDELAVLAWNGLAGHWAVYTSSRSDRSRVDHSRVLGRGFSHEFCSDSSVGTSFIASEGILDDSIDPWGGSF